MDKIRKSFVFLYLTITTNNMKSRKIILYIAVLLTAIGIWSFFQFAYEYSFYYKEQNQLFLMSADYLSTYFEHKAWAANMAGDFLTQLYYYTYAGAAILTLIITITGLMAICLMRKIGLKRPLAFVVGIAMMIFAAALNFNVEYRTGQLLSITGLLLTMIILVTPKWRRLQLHSWSTAGAIASLAFLPVGLWMFWQPDLGKLQKPDMDVERYLEIENLYYFGRHDEMLAKVGEMQNPTKEAAFYYYLVMAQRRQLPEVVNKVKPVNLGTLYQIGPSSTPIEIKMVGELYYVLGDMTLAEREALLACVFAPSNRNVRMVKRLAEANLVAGDYPAAMKYLRILDNTIAYRRWAKANRPTEEGKLRSVSLNDKRQYAIKNDTLRTSANCRDVLTTLLAANPHNRVALDYLLCTDYIVGARDMFMEDMKKYYIPTYGQPTEAMYRELLRN